MNLNTRYKFRCLKSKITTLKIWINNDKKREDKLPNMKRNKYQKHHKKSNNNKCHNRYLSSCNHSLYRPKIVSYLQQHQMETALTVMTWKWYKHHSYIKVSFQTKWVKCPKIIYVPSLAKSSGKKHLSKANNQKALHKNNNPIHKANKLSPNQKPVKKNNSTKSNSNQKTTTHLNNKPHKNQNTTHKEYKNNDKTLNEWIINVDY